LKLDLYIDEAYYYNWAKHLDFGYYSKPPMLSLLIAFTTWLFGDGVEAIKIGALLLYPVTSFVIYFIASEFFDKRVAFYSALVFYTLPSIWLSSLIISTDVVLLFFWSLALLFFIKALKYNLGRYWILSGIFSGFGLLSKYNFIFFLISVITVLVAIPKYRKTFTNRYFYIAIVLAFLIFLPNLWWNYQNDFISFVHTKEISQVDKDLLHPNKFFEFFAAQFIVFGPVLFFYFWVIVLKREFLKDERFEILFYFAIIMLGFIMVLSFLSRSFANWAAPTYVSGAVLVVAYLIKKGKERLVVISIVLHSILGIALYNYHSIASLLGVELTKRSDPYNRVLGWREAMERVGDIWQSRFKGTTLLATNRGDVAEADYYLKTKTYIYNPHKEMENQYHLDRDLNEKKGEDFLLFKESGDIGDLERYFERVERVGRADVELYGDYNRTYHLFYLKSFKGY
jgi:4-amino-4-deoxy-L-arabinose transferase-like glycosyltransferase